MAKLAGYTAIDLYKIAKNQRRLLKVVSFSLLLLCFFFALIYLSTNTPAGPNSLLVNGYVLGDLIENGNRTTLSPNVPIILALLTFVPAVIFAFLWLIVFVLLLGGLQTRVFTKAAAIVGSFVPIVSLIVLAVVLVRSSRVLKNAGCRVGLLGVSRKTLAGLKQTAFSPPSFSPPQMGR